MTKLAMCRVGATLIWLIVAGISIPAQDVASSRQLTWDELSNPPGSYSESVSLRPVGGRELEYRFIDHGGAPHTDYFLPLADGIELHAPRDAEVRYTVELRRVGDPATMIAGTFSVDTLAPHAPRFTQAPGLHTSPVVLRPEVPESLPSDMASVYVAVQRADGEDSEFSRITSDGVDLAGEPGAVLDYRVSAYALDNAGNRSAVATYRYRIDRSRAVLPAEHPIISPRAGRYANEQILLVDSSGLADISIVLSTPQGDQRRLEYAEMPVIAGTGEFAVTLTATVVSSGEPYRRTVTWSQETRPRMPEQGRTTSSIRVQPPSNPVRYNLEDLPVAPNDPQWLRSAELIPPPDGLRPVVIRYRGDGAEFDTRLAFLLDGRRAPLPHIASTAEPGTITLYSLAETEVQWAPMTETGLGRYSDVVLGSVEIALQDVTATELVSRARYPEGSWTQRTVALGPFRSDPPVAPQDFRDDGVTIAIGTAGEAGELTLIDESSQAEIVRFRGEYPLRWRPPPGFSATLRNERDRAGSVTVNRTPLAPPVVSFQERRLVLSGEGQIFYRIDGSSEAVYQTPLVLSGVSGARRRYRVDAYRIFRGQISPTVTVFPVIDERRPEVPPPRVRGGVARGPADFVSREEAPTVSFSSPYADLVLHYEATSTGEALLPQSDSPVVGDGIILSAPEAQETQWSIRVRGRFAGQERWSPVYRMTVTIDRHPPEAPVLTSDPGTTGIIAFEPPTEEDTSVWYRLRANAPFQRYEGPITINRDRLERALTVSAYTRDLVGNRTMLAETPMLEPLNQEPAPPQLMMNGRPISTPRVILSREALLEPLDPEGVRWRIVDGSDTADPGEYRQFESFREPRLLSPGTYRVNAYRERGGERSRVIERIVTIDPERPRKPNAPYLTYASDGRSGTVYWPGAQSEQIFASLVVDSQSDPPVEPFSVSDGTVRWHIPDGASSVSLVYFSVGDAGRRSETEVIRIEAARLRPPAQVSGVQNGERYQSERTIQFTGGGDIRFTATSDGSSPEAVRVSSTRYEEPLLVSAAVGETTQYRLRYRTFDGDAPVSEAREITFVIDREPPQPPALVGAVPDGYYGERRRVNLREGTAGDAIMYRIVTDPAAPPDFTRYQDDGLLLEEDATAPRRYRIDAYSVDSVGNRSPGIATWSITIDATSLHVSATHGDDRTGDGSRQAPLATLEEALQTIARSSRDTIFLTAGTYTVPAAVLTDHAHSEMALHLIGGYDPVTWRPGSAQSAITTLGGEIPPLRGTVRLERLSFSHALQVGAPGTEGRVELRHVEVRSEGSSGIIHVGGSLSVFDSSVSPAVDIRDGATFDAQGSSLAAVSVRGGSATITDSIMSGIRMFNGSRGSVSNSRIAADGTVDISGLIYAEDSTLELTSSLIRSTSEDPILVRGRDADIRITGSALYGTGERSAVAIRARGGRIIISDSMIDISSQGYAYGVFVRNVPVELTGSAVVMRSAADGIAIATSDGALTMDHSILWLTAADEAEAGAGRITATGVSADGYGHGHSRGIDDLVIRNSTMLSYGVNEVSSTALRLGSEGAARILDSALGGWPFSLMRSTSAEVWDRSGRILSVDDLNQSRFGRGNRLQEPSLPPPRRVGTPTIPQSPLPEGLQELRRHYSQNQSGPTDS